MMKFLPGVGLALSCLACGADSAGLGPPVPPPPPPPPTAGYEVAYATFIGGNADEELREPVLLPGGRVLFGARTKSTNMPTVAGGFQRSYGGGTGDSYLGVLSADGSSLAAGTYFGGSGMERPPYGIEVAGNGDVVFGSATASTNIPTTSGAFRRSASFPPSRPVDGYVCRISGDLGTIRWCTYAGGAWPRGGLALDGQENVVVAGDVTDDSPYPTSSGAFQRTARGVSDGFVLKLDSSGENTLFSTRLGGSSATYGEIVMSVRIFSDGDISLVGTSTSTNFPTTTGSAGPSAPGPNDVFLARLSADGSSTVYSALFGGGSTEFAEHRHEVLPDGSIAFGAITMSSNVPGAIGSYRGNVDGLVGKLNPDGSRVDLAAYVGGSGDDHLLGPVVDASGRVYVFGGTSSRDFPTTSNGLQPTYGGGAGDGFLMILGPNGLVEYSTFLGGSGDDLVRGVAVSANGDIYLGGRTSSSDFSTTPGAFQPALGGGYDGFLVKLTPR